MTSKKTTGKKSGRSKSKVATQEPLPTLRIQEVIVPVQPVALPAEVRPMPIQIAAQPSKTEASATGQPAPQQAPVETTITDKTALN